MTQLFLGGVDPGKDLELQRRLANLTVGLEPGLYSLVYGGNPAFSLGQGNVSYAFSATLTTAPVPVPAAAYLFGSGLIGLAGLARRKFSA